MLLAAACGCDTSVAPYSPALPPAPAPEPSPPPAPEPPPPPELTAPTGLKVADLTTDDRGYTWITWTWNPVPGVQEYLVGFRFDDDETEFGDLVTEPSFTTPEGLGPGRVMHVRVRALRERVAGPWSEPVTGGAPPEPTVRAVAQIVSEPSDPDGYQQFETIRVIVDFAEPVGVEGSPRLAIEIGDHVRFAEFLTWWEDDWPPERPSWGWRFNYSVGPDDEDADGITIQPDAFDLSEGAFLTRDGVEIEVEIYAVAAKHLSENPVQVEPGEPVASHAVIGRPDLTELEPRVCTDERQRARERNTRPVLVDEWDGTPFRFYFDEGIPASERADAEHFFGVVERLSERIEDQLGYSILEVAGWIPEVKRGFRVGHMDVEDCVGVRPGGIVGTVIPFEERYAAARAYCGVIYWTQNDIDSWDSTLAHEVFHLFGFGHSLTTHPQEAWQGGIPMSVRLTAEPLGPRDLGVTFEDVDAVGCVFPHPDFPR